MPARPVRQRQPPPAQPGRHGVVARLQLAKLFVVQLQPRPHLLEHVAQLDEPVRDPVLDAQQVGRRGRLASDQPPRFGEDAVKTVERRPIAASVPAEKLNLPGNLQLSMLSQRIEHPLLAARRIGDSLELFSQVGIVRPSAIERNRRQLKKEISVRPSAR